MDAAGSEPSRSKSDADRDLERAAALMAAHVRSDRLQPLSWYLALAPGREAEISEAFFAALAALAPPEGASPGPPGRDPLERYALGEVLGSGAQGIVHAAVDRDLDRPVAIKFVHPDRRDGVSLARERLKTEARLLARLDHPGLCPIYDVQIERRGPFVVMKCLEGETLRKLIERHEQTLARWGLHEILRFLEGLAEALQVAHEGGILHRDVKPGNIMVHEQRGVLFDFGLARLESPGVSQTTGVGTYAYLAPECLNGSHYDARADVYSLGITAYEVLRGVRPFEGESLASEAQQIRSGRVPPLSEGGGTFPKELEVIIQTAIHREPSLRYASARLFAEDLGRLRKGEAIRAVPVPRFTKARLWVRRNPTSAGLLSAGCALLAVLVILGVREVAHAANLQRAQLRLEDLKSEDLKGQAEAAMHTGSWGRAERIYGELLGRRPKEQARWRLGQAWAAYPQRRRGLLGVLSAIDFSALSGPDQGRFLVLKGSLQLGSLGLKLKGAETLGAALRLPDLAAADRDYAIAVLSDDPRARLPLLLRSVASDPYHWPAQASLLLEHLVRGRPSVTRRAIARFRLVFPNDIYAEVILLWSYLLEGRGLEGVALMREHPQRDDPLLRQSCVTIEALAKAIDAIDRKDPLKLMIQAPKAAMVASASNGLVLPLARRIFESLSQTFVLLIKHQLRWARPEDFERLRQSTTVQDAFLLIQEATLRFEPYARQKEAEGQVRGVLEFRKALEDTRGFGSWLPSAGHSRSLGLSGLAAALYLAPPEERPDDLDLWAVRELAHIGLDRRTTRAEFATIFRIYKAGAPEALIRMHLLMWGTRHPRDPRFLKAAALFELEHGNLPAATGYAERYGSLRGKKRAGRRLLKKIEELRLAGTKPK